jgi:hypothetical protein
MRKRNRLQRWLRRHRIIAGAVVATLLAAAGVAEAPGMGALVGLSGGTIRAVAPAGEAADDMPGGVYAMVDGVSARAGAPEPFWALRGYGESASDDASQSPGGKVVPYRDETQDLPWRRPAMVSLPQLVPALPASGLQPEPIAIGYPRTGETRELPPLRAMPVYVAYSFGLGPATRSERLTDLVKNDPIDAAVPDELAPPGVGSSVPPPPGAAVPEPTGGLIAAGVVTWALSRRRR